MSDRFRKLLPAMFAVLCGLCVVTASHAQSDKPISLVVGYSAGGSADFVARVVGEAMSKRLGRQIIIENVVGASGMLAVQKVLNAPADGSERPPQVEAACGRGSLFLPLNPSLGDPHASYSVVDRLRAVRW